MPIALIPKLPRLTPEDFDAFMIPDFAGRMEALRTRVRPKLAALGDALAPELSALLHVPVYAHVAKHARRTVNPPNDTWVAWSTHPRGYKAHPHFQFGLWGSHVFAQFALIDESPLKAPFARAAARDLDGIPLALPEGFRWSDDHTRALGMRHAELGRAGLKAFFERAERVAKAEVLCGVDLSRQEALALSGEDLAACALSTFKTTLGLYRLAQAAEAT